LLQARVVHIIISGLLHREALSTDPRNVELEREGYKSIFPCGRGWPGLDISQLDWAIKEGSWWFNGPIKRLKISKVKKAKLSHADLLTFKRLAIR